MLRELTIATWNCFGMAQGAIDAITASRAPHRDRLDDEDVRLELERAHLVCIQEVLSTDAERFFDRLGQMRVRDHNRMRLSPVSFRGSGLGIAGCHALDSTEPKMFASPRSGWDRLARKGTLHARVALDGITIDVLNVHLQAGDDPTAVAIRRIQLTELSKRVAELGHDDRPFIVCGDLNICGLGQSGDCYAKLREALPGFDDLGIVDDRPTYDPHPERNPLAYLVEPGATEKRLDYIFLRAPRSKCVDVRVRNVGRILDRPLRPRQTAGSSRAGERSILTPFASDHFGVVATLEFARLGD